MKRFRLLRSRKRLVFQSKQIFAGLSKTKTEIDLLKGTLRWVCFFTKRFFCFYSFFIIWAKRFWLLAKLFQKVPKTSIYESLATIRRDKFFLKIWYKWCTFLILKLKKKRFLSLKVSEALRKPHFPCPEQILKKKIQKKLFFPSVPDFEQSYRVFEQTSSGVGKKNFIVVKTALYFPEVHFEDKSLWRKSKVFESGYDFEERKSYGVLARTVWQCHQNCFLWVQTNKLKNKSSKLYFYLFWDYGEGLIIFDIKNSEVLSKPNSRWVQDQFDRFLFSN